MVPTGVHRGLPTSAQVLTEREHEVLRLLVQGLPTRHIAERMVITTATVKLHTRSICCKPGTKTHTETVAYALHHYLVPDE